MTVEIQRVDNGYILRVIVSGLSTLKDPYSNAIYVFTKYSDLIDFLDDRLNEEKIK